MMSRRSTVVSDKSVYENMDFTVWSKESYDISITLYDGIEEGVALPQEYIDTNLILCEERITLGGHRLAYLIQYMFPATNGLFL
jgi:hypothetical protein